MARTKDNLATEARLRRLVGAIESLFPAEDWQRFYADLPPQVTVELKCSRGELLELARAVEAAKGDA